MLKFLSILLAAAVLAAPAYARRKKAPVAGGSLIRRNIEAASHFDVRP